MCGTSLNSEGSKQLNYGVLCKNMLDDIQQPLESRVCQTNAVKPYHIVCNAKEYVIETVPQTKKYQMVYSKHVITPVTFLMNQYGNLRCSPKDEEMAELLCDL